MPRSLASNQSNASGENSYDYKFYIEPWFYNSKGEIIKKNQKYPKDGYRGPIKELHVYSDSNRNCKCSVNPSKINPEEMTEISGTCPKTYEDKKCIQTIMVPPSWCGRWEGKDFIPCKPSSKCVKRESKSCPPPSNLEFTGYGGSWGIQDNIDNFQNVRYILNTKPKSYQNNNNPINKLCRQDKADPNTHKCHGF